MFRIVFMSDTHCGHRAGLTPPGYQIARQAKGPHKKFAKMQREMWDWYAKTAAAYRARGGVAMVVANGDMVDGKGSRTGGTEQEKIAMAVQADMAAECINLWNPRIVYLIHGTGYHVGAEDWEGEIVPRLSADEVYLEDHAFIKIFGVVFDVKHKIGRSTIPHGRFTPLARAKLWNALWHARIARGKPLQPDAQVVVRSHVHYHVYCGDKAWLALTLPGLMGYGSKYGQRECENTIDFGVVLFDVEEDGMFTWEALCPELGYQVNPPRVHSITTRKK